jgi:hypothetical protein
MQNFIAVLKDLWEFVWKESVFYEEVVVNSLSQTVTVSPKVPPLALPATATKLALAQPVPAMGLQGEKAFVVLAKARLLQRPVVSLDGALQTLTYADSVHVLGYEGRFAHVTHGAVTGWVFKDALALQAQEVFPIFYSSEIYSVNHPDTKKLRRLTDDEFMAGELSAPLQSVEFVLYRLREIGRKIDWGTVRPRLAGNWQNILKGKLGIQIGIRAKTGSIIEYVRPDGTGFVGYTKAVHIDESIVIEGVGRLIEGEYREEHVIREEWHEWRPVFIQVQ